MIMLCFESYVNGQTLSTVVSCVWKLRTKIQRKGDLLGHSSQKSLVHFCSSGAWMAHSLNDEPFSLPVIIDKQK